MSGGGKGVALSWAAPCTVLDLREVCQCVRLTERADFSISISPVVSMVFALTYCCRGHRYIYLVVFEKVRTAF